MRDTRGARKGKNNAIGFAFDLSLRCYATARRHRQKILSANQFQCWQLSRGVFLGKAKFCLRDEWFILKRINMYLHISIYYMTRTAPRALSLQNY